MMPYSVQGAGWCTRNGRESQCKHYLDLHKQGRRGRHWRVDVATRSVACDLVGRTVINGSSMRKQQKPEILSRSHAPGSRVSQILHVQVALACKRPLRLLGCQSRNQAQTRLLVEEDRHYSRPALYLLVETLEAAGGAGASARRRWRHLISKMCHSADAQDGLDKETL